MAQSSSQLTSRRHSRFSQRAFFQEGTVLQKRYSVEHILSDRGPGQALLVTDLRFPGNRWVLKVYKKLPAEDFHNEMKAQASFHHPNLVKVVDFFEEGDFSCAVLEYVHGRSLEQILDDTVGPLPERQVLSWGVQCADALLYLHSHQNGFTHYRNLSPTKMLISTIGELKLLPQIPKVLSSTTPPGVMGYSPPEAFDDNKTPDERSDIYSLGAILHRCLIGGNPESIPFAFIPIDPVNPQLDSAIERVLDKATQAHPGRRFASLSDFRREAHHCLAAVLSLQPHRRRTSDISAEFWWLLAAVSGAALAVWTYILWVTNKIHF